MMMDNQRRNVGLTRTAALVALLALLLLSGTAQAEPAATLALKRAVIGGGGGQGANGGYTLGGTIGQSVAGVRETASHELCAGFWCGLGRYEIYLPVLLREA
jgi:hypothetical protein